MENKNTIEQLAKKYPGLKPAYVAALEKRVLDLEKLVQNLENDVEALMSYNYHDESHRAYGEAVMRSLTEVR